MARVHGKDVNFSFNGVAIEDELDEVNLIIDVPEDEITSFADAWQNFVAGKKNVRTEIAGSYDPAASNAVATLHAAISGGPVTTIFDPTGAGPDTNDPEYTCTSSGLTGVLVERMVMQFATGNRGTLRATLQHSGLTTRAVS